VGAGASAGGELGKLNIPEVGEPMALKCRQLLQPSSFKAGCVVIVLAVAVYLGFWQGAGFRLIRNLDDRIIDEMMRIRGRMLTSGQVVIVDLDEKSLAEHGQWPWPRTRVAQLIQAIGAADALLTGLDIVFAESDGRSPHMFVEALRPYVDGTLELPDGVLNNDIVLGDAVADAKVILGYFFVFNDDGVAAGNAPFPVFTLALENLSLPELSLQLLRSNAARRAVLNVEDVCHSALSEGFFNAEPELDGVLRKVPLLAVYNDVAYPSLALEMVHEVLGRPLITFSAGKRGLAALQIGEHYVATDYAAHVRVNFRGPRRTFTYVSASDVLAGEPAALAALRGRMVLVGTSSVGLADLKATPLDKVFPGVEVHANIIDNILQQDALRFDAYTENGVVILTIVIGGLALAAALAFAGALFGGLLGMALLGFICWGNYALFFSRGQVVGMTYPLLMLVAIYMVVTLFNYFIEDRQKRFISSAFGRYVSPEVVKQLVRQPDRLALHGEQKIMSVMFSDIRGFTSISEAMSASEITTLLNEYLTAMTEIVITHRGTVDKFIGDAVMALWGAPLDDAEHAANATLAALEMIRVLDELRPHWVKQGYPPLHIGIGINSGEMHVGNMGSSTRFDYTVIGDNVNLASRLEGLTKAYGASIIIAESTRQLLGDRFCVCLLDRVRVKGKTLPVAIYEPLGEVALVEPAVRQQVQRFEYALELYFQQKFSAAYAEFASLHSETPRQLYEMYCQRSEAYLQTPPPSAWDGAFTFTTK